MENKNTEIKIIEAVPDDVYGIRNVQKLTWLETYPNEELGISRADIESRFANDDTEEGKKRMEERKQRYYDDHSLRTWIAKDGENIVGFCVARKVEGQNRIQAIYLLPNYQGKSVGKQLMETALNWLGNNSDVYVNVASYNNKAIQFYEKFGFAKTGKEVKDDVAVLPSGKTIPEIELLKIISRN